MAAANTDLFRKATNNFSSTLTGTIGASDTTMSLASVTDLPTDTAIDLVIDRVDSSGTLTPTTREYVKGVVSGTNIISLVRGLGNSTGQTHVTGAVVEMVPTGETQTDLVAGILAQHSQAGAHIGITNTGGLATDTITSSGLITASNGLTLSAGTLTLPNNAVTAPMLAAGAITYPTLGTDSSYSWTAFTPTWSNLTVGNGTATCYYTQLGKTVIAKYHVALGTTSAVSNSPYVTLPVGENTSVYPHTTQNIIAQGALAAGGTLFLGAGSINTVGAGYMQILCLNASGSYTSFFGLSATVPGTFGSGDYIDLVAVYEAA